ncbi:uncharacterized protein TNCV_4153881 [Trichonephila clavipes]|nr:uncharacterized protein TNCV_4153881 [Trichonephila clavipes]
MPNSPTQTIPDMLDWRQIWGSGRPGKGKRPEEKMFKNGSWEPMPVLLVRESTGAHREGSICAWMVADEAGGFTRAFLTMWRSSRRLVCRGRPETGVRVNDISQIHWCQHLITTQSERPN